MRTRLHFAVLTLVLAVVKAKLVKELLIFNEIEKYKCCVFDTSI